VSVVFLVVLAFFGTFADPPLCLRDQVIDYTRLYRPRILIVENFVKAPWDTMVKYLSSENYSSSVIK